MKITFVIANLAKRSGGPPNEVINLGRELAAMGVQVRVLAQPAGDTVDIPAEISVAWVTGGWRAKLRQVRTELQAADFVFVWGIWSKLEGPLFRFLRPSSCRYACKTLGMLAAYIMARNRALKTAARLVYVKHNLGHAAAVLVDTPAELARVESLGLSRRVRLCRNGVAVPALLGVPRARTILYLGRIVPKKGLDLLLDAMPAVRRNHPDVKVIVAGEFDGADYKRLIEEKVREHRLEEATMFAGQVTGTDKLRLLQSAGCFVLPSHSEGFSNAVLEALAAGTPVFITPGCNFPEVESDGLGAVLPRDPAVWSERLTAFFSGTTTGIKSAGEIRDHVQRNFSWRHSASILLELARSPSAPPS